ncbi:hypothetical protein LguiA_022634 [Lonicera macranthoides]
MGIRKHSSYIPFIFLLCFTLNISLSYGANDTITTTQSLTGDQTLVSSGGKFELGFFKPGNSRKYYIGMWYKNVSLQTIIWVANRDTPVTDKFYSQLKIVDGNLVLLDRSRAIIWSTNINLSSSNSIVAVLRDDGNLVLIDGSTSNGENPKPIWESFNHPTDTLLPGAKLGYNKLTKSKQILTSWKNSEDPGTGLFFLEIDPIGSQFIIRLKGSESFWSGGSWNSSRHLNSMFSFIDNENETYSAVSDAASVTTSEGDLISLLDHRLDNNADAEEVTRICKVACWCLQDEENLRPSMGQVVQILEGVLDVKLPQMPPSLQLLADNQEEYTFFFTQLSSGLSSQAQVLPLSISH